MTPTDETRTRDEVVVECEMDASPEKVWRALTEEALLTDWLGARPAEDAAPQEANYRILEAEPTSLVRYAWHDPAAPDAPPTVTVELEPLPGGRTRFRLTHGTSAAGTTRPAANLNSPPLALAA